MQVRDDLIDGVMWKLDDNNGPCTIITGECRGISGNKLPGDTELLPVPHAGRERFYPFTDL